LLGLPYKEKKDRRKSQKEIITNNNKQIEKGTTQKNKLANGPVARFENVVDLVK